MTTDSHTDPADSGADRDPITKIGTEVFGLRVISGYLHAADPGQILLRQLYPGRPANIGNISAIGSGNGRLTINPDRATEWADHDRTALAVFFLTRYSDRIINRPTATPTAAPNTTRTSLGANDDRAA